MAFTWLEAVTLTIPRPTASSRDTKSTYPEYSHIHIHASDVSEYTSWWREVSIRDSNDDIMICECVEDVIGEID